MSLKAEYFLEGWAGEHARLNDQPNLPAEPHSLAERCVADAHELGITREELVQAAGGELTGYIFWVMAEVEPSKPR